MSGTWSIRRRVSRWLLALVLLQAILVVVPAALLVSSSLDAELSSLLEEELAEFSSSMLALELRGETDPGAYLEEFLAESSAEHPLYPMAIGIWRSGERIAVAGSSDLVDHLPGFPRLLDQRVDDADWIAWRANQLEGGPGGDTMLAVLIDGRAQAKDLGGFGLVMLAVVLVVAALGLGFSVLIAGRVSTLVGGLSVGVRHLLGGQGDGHLEGGDLPVEVLPFVAELREGIEELRVRTDRFRLMTAGLAHELRSPVQNLIGETEVALMKQRDERTDQALLTSNLDELRDLGDAIHNLLQLASEGDELSNAHERFDLGEEAAIRLGADLARARRKGVEVQLESTGDLGLEGDREGVLRAVRNLVANGVSWTPAGQRVEVRFEGLDGEVCVHVDDSGPGVPEALRESIFEPFFQGPVQDDRRAGYGLGLAMVRGAVLHQGGTVVVGESRLGGARFELRLPRVPGALGQEGAAGR
ncbi:MAG: HAMP domain-containing sensor histidine kinase [Planctomycetota bacterium]|nr:HAMP domain-containing sensor histidine kinase [Planctomycetota bacterium]